MAAAPGLGHRGHDGHGRAVGDDAAAGADDGLDGGDGARGGGYGGRRHGRRGGGVYVEGRGIVLALLVLVVVG